MQLLISVGSESRVFSKAMRRIRPVFDRLTASVAAQPLAHPTPTAIVVGLTNSLPLGELQEVPNQDGFFQVLCGLGPWDQGPEGDARLRRMAWDAVSSAIEACPFALPDRAQMARLVADEECQAFAAP